MRTTIFIRSYKGDFEWLAYCVESIMRYCCGFEDVILVVPDDQIADVPSSVCRSVDQLIPVHERTHGYIDQQITKLRAHHYTDSEQILFVDSDCIMQRHNEPSDWMQNGKPLLLREHYDYFNQPGNIAAYKWKAITEAALGMPVDYEYMRRVPILLNRQTPVELESHYPYLIDYVSKIQGHEFSEFNVLGAFAAHYQPSLYSIVDAPSGISNPAKQYWSWGGISEVVDEIRNTIGIYSGPRSRNQFGDYLNEKGLNGFGCEIGTAYGEYAEQILKRWHGTTIFCVDPWKKWPDEQYVDDTGRCDFDVMYMRALNRLAKYPGRVSFVRQESDVAVKMFPDNFFDFVYVDGNHHEPQISRDLNNWYPKVKPGGIFCGHDYYDLDTPSYRCEVKKAVDAFAMTKRLEITTTIEPGDTSWWIVKGAK